MDDRGMLREVSHIFSLPERYRLCRNGVYRSLNSVDVEIRRSKEQVEFTIEDEIIIVPTSVDRMEECRLAAVQVARFNIGLIESYKIESVVFSSESQPDHSTLTDVAVVRQPRGVRLDRWRGDSQALSRVHLAITLLDTTLRQLGIYFNSLCEEDIIVGEDGLLYPIQLDQLRFGHTSATPSECDELRRLITERFGECEAEEKVSIGEYPMRCSEAFEGYLCSDEVNEERVAVEGVTGWGFVDSKGNVTTPLRYRKVYPYCEGRAIVLSDSGWGLIDLYGREIITSTYESISYNRTNNICCVREGGLWGYFSYLGQQLTPISYKHPDEDISLSEVLALSGH